MMALPDSTVAKLKAGTHALEYDGFDGKRYRASYRRESGVAFLDVRRADGKLFAHPSHGRPIAAYQPIMWERELSAFVDSTVRDPAARPALKEAE